MSVVWKAISEEQYYGLRSRDDITIILARFYHTLKNDTGKLLGCYLAIIKVSSRKKS